MCRTALPRTITNPCSSTTLSPVFHPLKETESPINKSQEPTTIDKTNKIIDEVSIEETPNMDKPSIKSTSESSIIEDSFADIQHSKEKAR